MASYQRVALFILFDAIERDLISAIRGLALDNNATLLTSDERTKASARLQRRSGARFDERDDDQLLTALDMSDKIAILRRDQLSLDESAKFYYRKVCDRILESLPIRNATMHGRPLTTVEYATGFALANELVKTPVYWPELSHNLRLYKDHPEEFTTVPIEFLDDDIPNETLHNLPIPDYEDTGFLPRPDLEKDLRKKILGRHPVVTILGEGGNGKTALALQTLYGLIDSHDHNFDAIIWVSAKSTRLSTREIERIENEISSSLNVYEEIADLFEPGEDTALARVRRLLNDNKILLIIDNLETVLDDSLRDFASDVPGESKLIFTSRVPIGLDLSVKVGDFSDKEAHAYLRRLANAYNIKILQKCPNDQIDKYARRLNNKPLLLKWFALGVLSGLSPESITSNPEIAVRFCMENVIERLSHTTKKVASIIALLPGSISPSLVQTVSSFTAKEIETALSELLNFGLIERNESVREQLLQIKPLARSYIAKTVKISANESLDILNKYKSIEVAYQMERGSGTLNKYDFRSFTVRSRSEVIALRDLRRVISLGLKESFEECENILRELKISNSDYFEVFRTDAFVAYRQGDIVRATNSYEIALDLAEDLPQMHFFYAGFLTRFLSDFAGASFHLAKALDLDGANHQILREAARNKLFEYKFDEAKEYLDRCSKISDLTLREEIVTADLRSQLFTRKADYLSVNGDNRGAIDTLYELGSYVSTLSPDLIDEMHAEHLRRIGPIIERLRASTVGNTSPILNDLSIQIVNIVNSASVGSSRPRITRAVPASADDVGQTKLGRLRIAGLKETFGFIRDTEDVETYTHRDIVGEEIWREMRAGAEVQFEVAENGGKFFAVNVRLT